MIAGEEIERRGDGASPDAETAIPAPRADGTSEQHASRVVLLVGNPNVGKTRLFNRLGRQHARVGNYPGVTVERRSATVSWEAAGNTRIEFVDIPGTYSLSARSPEEQIAIGAILGEGRHPKPALAVVVVDAGQLVRNLYLALQIAELRVPMVLAINMIDEARDCPPHLPAIEALFGVACVATNARTGEGVDALERAITDALNHPRLPRIEVRYPRDLVGDADAVADALPESWRSSVERDRTLALWALSSISEDDELTDVPPALRQRCLEVRAKARGRDIDRQIISSRYELLDSHSRQLTGREEAHVAKRKLTDRVDAVLLHPVSGFLVFLATMLVVFQALFSWADPAIRAIEALVGATQDGIHRLLPQGVLRELLADGIVGGVGNVVVFLPQILLLFLFIGLLEDSGYMARVAYLMDRVMRLLGLHGRAFVPMLSGFACAVPAILATRTMERQRDRLLTMMVVPLMTCSARLPVYTLIIGALFPPMALFGWLPVQGLLLVGMYVFSTLTALLAAAVLGRSVIRGRRVPLVLELPPYRMPDLGTTLRMMWERAAVFLKEAGTIILVCTVVLWALLSFPKADGALPGDADRTEASATASGQAEGKPVALGNEAAETMAPAGAERRHGAAGVRASTANGALARVSGGVDVPASTEVSSKSVGPAGANATPIGQTWGGRLGKLLEPALEPLGFDWRIGVGLVGAFAAREVFVSTMALIYGIEDSDDGGAPLRERIRSEALADGTPRYTPLVGLSLLVFFALACQCMSTLAVVRRETRTWRWPAFMFAYMTGLAWVASFVVYQGGKLLGF